MVGAKLIESSPGGTSTPANSAAVVAVTSAAFEGGNSTVKLVLASPLESGVDYTVRASNVEDLAGNVINSNVGKTFTFTRFSLTGEPYTFIPRRGETYPITFTVPQEIQVDGETLLRIFDMTGRLRRTLFDSRFEGQQSVIDWDGKDDRQELVPAGTYIAHLSIVDRISGNRDELQIAVVVATRLNR